MTQGGKLKLLYGTGNEAKFVSMQRLLSSLNIELISLKDRKESIPEVAEIGQTPLENARLKAKSYFKAFQIPVFSCDSGLYFDNVPDEIQPGIHVRLINGKRLNDEEIIEYYAALANKYGDLTARYCNAICFIKDSKHIYESMDQTLSGERFVITNIPHQKRMNGFPLDSLSIHISSGKYYYDMDEQTVEETALENGFRQFFVDCNAASP